MADIEDVARAAGVSTATVSRALRGLSNVSEPTKQRVRAAADELGYRVSRYASGLASGRTTTVAIVVPHVARWFFGHVIAGAEEAFRAAGYDLLLYTMQDTAARDRFFTELPLKGRVDAVLVLCLPLTEEQADALRALDVPLALVGAETRGFSTVRIDDRAGARMAVRHLVNLGHRKIGLIAGDIHASLGFTTPHERLAGYRDVLDAAGIDQRPEWVAEGHFTTVGGEHAMNTLLTADQRPTAVFAMSDEMAMGALRSLRRHRMSVPDDMSIIGFDDHELAEVLDLTTVAQPVTRQGALAAQRLLEQLQTGGATTTEIVPVQLLVRGSTRSI